MPSPDEATFASEEEAPPTDQGTFKDKLLKLLDWVSEHDPMAAAKLVSEWSDDVARELTCGCERPCGAC